jgi:hypothetical protein
MTFRYLAWAAWLGLAFLTGTAMAYEEPEYRVVRETDEFELREYAPYIVAETVVEGDYRSSGNKAFRILAGYIFGDNRSAEKMAMTAPVTADRGADGEKMKMTVPVTSSPDAGDGRYRYQFVMERKYTLETLPVPNDERVTLREVPARLVAARRYSGRRTERNFLRHRDALLSAIEAAGLEPLSAPQSAAYNGPFTLPMLRRNEVLVEVAPADGAVDAPGETAPEGG